MPRKTNFYQDISEDEKQCAECKEIKSYANDFYFQKNQTGKKYPRPECKKCWTVISSGRQNEALIKRYPHRYWQCDKEDCFHVNGNNLKMCFRCRRGRNDEARNNQDLE